MKRWSFPACRSPCRSTSAPTIGCCWCPEKTRPTRRSGSKPKCPSASGWRAAASPCRCCRSIADAGALADTAGYSPDLNFHQKLQLLETFDVVARLTLALQFQRERLAEQQVRKRLREDVEDGAQKQQREYFLRRQMDAIRKELGEKDGSVADEYRQTIAGAGMPDAVRQQAEREADRLERMGDSNGESSMIRTYLDWLLAVPWSKRSEERLDPVPAREVLA